MEYKTDAEYIQAIRTDPAFPCRECEQYDNCDPIHPCERYTEWATAGGWVRIAKGEENNGEDNRLR